MTRGGGKKKKGRMVKPDGYDQVSMHKKRLDETASMMESQWDTSQNEQDCLDASMISFMDTS
jgi:hypothetical protein